MTGRPEGFPVAMDLENQLGDEPGPRGSLSDAEFVSIVGDSLSGVTPVGMAVAATSTVAAVVAAMGAAQGGAGNQRSSSENHPSAAARSARTAGSEEGQPPARRARPAERLRWHSITVAHVLRQLLQERPGNGSGEIGLIAADWNANQKGIQVCGDGR